MIDLIGEYTLKSPYHKRKRLPFNVISCFIDREFNMVVETVEYKGKTRHEIKTNYTSKSIREMIEKGILIKL